MPTSHLLDQLAAMEGCDYLSDLHRRPGLYDDLLRLPAGDFPVEEWRDALCYLTGEPLPEGTAETCRERLLERFQKATGAPWPGGRRA